MSAPALPEGHLQRFLLDVNDRLNRGYYDERPGEAPLAQRGSFLAALRSAQHPVIAEVKRRSPSEGRLTDRTAHSLAQEYHWGGAAALSVLTDPDNFDGSLSDLQEAHRVGLPLLMKDFIIDERQLDAAARNGASAVLLIERLFPSTPERREELVAAAHDRGLEVLLEVCTMDEAHAACESTAELIGVNARNLDTLEVDLGQALQIVRHVAQLGRPVLALSGMSRRGDRIAAMQAGAEAVLVGTAVAKAPHPGLALRAIQRPLAKVCGLTRVEDVDAAANAGADLAGVVVAAPRSPRSVSIDDAALLVAAARKCGVRTVLVTPTDDAAALAGWADLVQPDFVQVHNAKLALDHVRKMLPSRVEILVARAPGAASPEIREASESEAAGYVFDTPHTNGVTGGAGVTHDWQLTAQMAAKVPNHLLTLVAGGLDSSNVAAAIVASTCRGADASSALEAKPGMKDPDAVARFVEATHAA